MVTAAFGACVPCVAAAVTTALGGFTCALPPTWRGQGGDGGWVGGTDANERALQRSSLWSPCCLAILTRVWRLESFFCSPTYCHN
ncbi:hypothetical protein PR003_g17502 [Phytophthora rubi]|uniref:Secreted protein n=1 Tax=Phytophthora rubi TaxID=129364 RepID=A0A6A3KH29_9STRA|nr:hypothetical protein PR002_g17440 [Phytophthora rubi]KAE9008363.1 hypothetical protein PR001_g16714 [Phytophthora rubi]KAE9321311.1 hypothetical protein PR003_g17502 [Phytophthora rubi]